MEPQPALSPALSTRDPAEQHRFVRLTQAQWEAIEAVLPRTVYTRDASADVVRRFIEASLWIMATGRNWPDLPVEQYGSWRKNYVRANRWVFRGIWLTVLGALGPDCEWSALIGEHVRQQTRRKQRRDRRRELQEAPLATL